MRFCQVRCTTCTWPLPAQDHLVCVHEDCRADLSDDLATLLESADGLLDGRRASAVSDTEQVARRFPHLVHVAVTPFGRTGPSAGWAATDLTVAAAGGMLAQVGHPDTPPLQLPHQQAEQLAGANAAIGALLGDAAEYGPVEASSSTSRPKSVWPPALRRGR